MQRICAILRACAPRLRLRSFLLAITAATLAAGWFTERARRQRDAVAAVRTYGIVWYEEPSDYPILGSVQTWIGEQFGDDFAYRAIMVRINRDQASDFAALAKLPWIEFADLGGVTLNGAMLSDLLVRMPNIRSLRIWNPVRLTADDLLRLQDARRLDELSIGLFMEPEDRAAELLKNIPELRRLRILAVSCPRLTVPMLRDLSKATALERLDVIVQESSPEKIKRLQKALPGCKVYEGRTY